MISSCGYLRLMMVVSVSIDFKYIPIGHNSIETGLSASKTIKKVDGVIRKGVCSLV
jgi:hypothetical protein